MSILSWNCQGLGQPSTIHELMHLVRQFCPKIVFLSETRQQKDRVSNIRWRMELNKLFVVDGQGKGGDLALY
jgi:exonuclease III